MENSGNKSAQNMWPILKSLKELALNQRFRKSAEKLKEADKKLSKIIYGI